MLNVATEMMEKDREMTYVFEACKNLGSLSDMELVTMALNQRAAYNSRRYKLYESVHRRTVTIDDRGEVILTH